MVKIRDIFGREIKEIDASTLEEVYLVSENLTCANLIYKDLRNSNLRYVILTKSTLTNANLAGCDMSYATIINADLDHADLSDTVLDYANFINSNLKCANLSGASARYANFTNTNLSWSKLIDTDFKRASLNFSNLTNADLRRAKLDEASIINAKFNYTLNVSQKYRSDLNILRSCTERIIAYKLLKKDLTSLSQKKKYIVGKTYSELYNDYDDGLYKKAITLATLEHCLTHNKYNKIKHIIAEFSCNPKDIIISFNSSGKFRIKSDGKVVFERVLSEDDVNELLRNN